MKIGDFFMFTGIITHLGKVDSITKSCYTFSADRSFFQKLGQGGSVAVNGVCLTVNARPKTYLFSIEVMPETVKKTTIGTLKLGDYVNLELPLSADALFEGHMVQGHVDGTGMIKKIKSEGNSHIFTIKVKSDLSYYLIDKGSIAVNGISLTIIKAGQSSFTVGVIPYTWKTTMLQYSKTGDPVNIEVDILAKYVEKFIAPHRR